MIETNAPANIIIHINFMTSQGLEPDTIYIKELCEIEIEYLEAYDLDETITWHDVRDQWLDANEHSPRFGERK